MGEQGLQELGQRPRQHNLGQPRVVAKCWELRKVEEESRRVGGFHSRESVALPLTYSLFGAMPHASGNTRENLVSAASQLLAVACLSSDSWYSKEHWGIYSWSLTAPLRGVWVFYHCFAHGSGEAVQGFAFCSQGMWQRQSLRRKHGAAWCSAHCVLLQPLLLALWNAESASEPHVSCF